jgi:hypothetical protein
MLNMADTGGRRNEKPLTDEQFNQAKEYAVSLGMPPDRIRYSNNSLTGYLGGHVDSLVIGTDVVPLNQRSANPNDNITVKGTVAHELVGHREASLNGFTKPTFALEEAQASIRAARFAPDLDISERIDLIRDAIKRLNNAGLSLRSVKDELFIKER